MDVNVMIHDLQRFLSPVPVSLKNQDPFGPLSEALEYVFRGPTTLRWIGLYLVSRERNELALGPFFGPPRPEVRFPASRIPRTPGLWIRGTDFGYNCVKDTKWIGTIYGQTQGTAPSPDLSLVIESLGRLSIPWIVDCDREDPFS